MAVRIKKRRASTVFGRSNNSIYIDGNTVRRIEPRFGERNSTGTRERSVKRGEELQLPQISFGYYLFFFVALAVTAFVCLWYVRIQSEITASQKRVTALEGTLTGIRNSNDEEYERIVGSIDMEEIKKVAMTDLRMKYPEEDQVVRITVENDDYVRQYGKIPVKSE